MEIILKDDFTCDLFSSLKSGGWPTADHIGLGLIKNAEYRAKWDSSKMLNFFGSQSRISL